MKARYRLFRRGWGVYYCEDTHTGHQESLKTSDKLQAQRLVAGKNEADQQPAFSRHLARVYWKAGDPAAAERTWQHVMDALVQTKHGNTRHRWDTAIRDKAFDSIRAKVVLQTGADDFLKVLNDGTVSTNVFLRRIHNFALDLDWLPWPILPKKRWPAARYKDKRAITLVEHMAIVAREPNEERKTFYQLCWYLGGSQSDIASLKASDIDYEKRVISYVRVKTKTMARFQYGEEVEDLLSRLPKEGPLFPYLITVREADRATEFRQRCQGLGIQGVSLHSYRYAWAERAKKAGYPERFAQEALGHGSKAVHRAYAKNADFVLPALESFEERRREEKLIPLPKSG